MQALNRFHFVVSSKKQSWLGDHFAISVQDTSQGHWENLWGARKEFGLVVIPSSVFISNMGICLYLAECHHVAPILVLTQLTPLSVFTVVGFWLWRDFSFICCQCQDKPESPHSYRYLFTYCRHVYSHVFSSRHICVHHCMFQGEQTYMHACFVVWEQVIQRLFLLVPPVQCFHRSQPQVVFVWCKNI